MDQRKWLGHSCQQKCEPLECFKVLHFDGESTIRIRSNEKLEPARNAFVIESLGWSKCKKKNQK